MTAVLGEQRGKGLRTSGNFAQDKTGPVSCFSESLSQGASGLLPVKMTVFNGFDIQSITAVLIGTYNLEPLVGNKRAFSHHSVLMFCLLEEPTVILRCDPREIKMGGGNLKATPMRFPAMHENEDS